jgi:hypothetical protein
VPGDYLPVTEYASRASLASWPVVNRCRGLEQHDHQIVASHLPSDHPDLGIRDTAASPSPGPDRRERPRTSPQDPRGDGRAGPSPARPGGQPHATVRVIPKDAVFWERRGHNFDVLSFAGTTDRIGVRYIPFLGAELASGDLYDLWARIQTTLAADPDQSRAILERHLPSMTT